MINQLQLKDAKRAPRLTGDHQNTGLEKYHQEQLRRRRGDNANKSSRLPIPQNGVRDNPGLYTL
jgi:hypothetical protein